MSIPKLLVSVRSASESQAAIVGGADVIDIKEPDAGSLGRAPWQRIQEIRHSVRQANTTLPCSAALGELIDWQTPQPNELDCLNHLSFVKLGPAGTCDDSDNSETDIAVDLSNRLKRVHQEVHEAVSQSPSWVAVSYADFRMAKCPEPAEIQKAARRLNCRALLIDTFSKGECGLFSFLSIEELRQLRLETRECGMLLAVAGQLTANHLDSLRDVQPDIVAVRGAVCESGSRTDQVTADRVRSFREAMDRVFGV